MAEGRRAEEWVWWAEILALTANCHRDTKKSKPVLAESIHPYRAKKKSKNKSAVGDAISAAKSRYGGIKGGMQNER